MKRLSIRNQVFPLHKCLSGHLKHLQLRTFWIQNGQKTWFLTAPCYVWLTILLAFVLLPAQAMAAPALPPDETHLARQGPTVRIDPVQSVVEASQTFDISVMIE